MPRWRNLNEEQIRELQPRFWVKLIGVVVLACYLIAFVLDNRKAVHLHFVFFTAKVSQIWLILLILAIGILLGALLSQLNRRRGRN